MFTLPILDVKADPLDALLYGLGLRLSYLAKNGNNDAYNALIKDKELAIQFVSGDVARYYRFVDGCFGQASGIAKNPDLTVDFKDSITGTRLLTKGDLAAFMTAIQDGDVKITGDYKLVLWFVGVAKEAATVPDEYKGYINQAKPYLDQAKPYIQKISPYAKQAGGLASKLFTKVKS